jgi:hypothetical protein
VEQALQVLGNHGEAAGRIGLIRARQAGEPQTIVA